MSPRYLLALALLLSYTPAQANTAQVNNFEFVLDAVWDPSCGCYDASQTIDFVVLPDPALHALTGGDAEVSVSFSRFISAAACMSDPSDPLYGALQCSYSYTVDALAPWGVYADGGTIHDFGDDISVVDSFGSVLYPDTSGLSFQADVDYISTETGQSDFSPAEFTISLSAIQGTIELVPEPITAPAIIPLILALFLRTRRRPLPTPHPS
jgi:hypothetical protein